MFVKILRSFLAVLAGVVFGVGLTLATDFAMHRSGIFPTTGRPMSGGLFLLATVYRTIFGIAGAWLIAWLAPVRPMLLVMIAGAIGFLVSAAGTILTWDNGPDFGPHWYPIALVILAFPQSWFGAKLQEWFAGSGSRLPA